MIKSQPPVQVNISSLTIVKIVLVVLGLFFVWAIRDIVAIVVIAWILASALNPLINHLQRYRIPRALGILSVYILFLGAISGIIIVLVPSLSNELSSLAQNFPSYYQDIRQFIDSLRDTGEQLGVIDTIRNSLDATVAELTHAGNGLYDAVVSIFGGVAAVIGVLVIAFYMTVEEDGLKKFFQSIVPVNYQPYIMHKVNQIQVKLSGWLWGQLVLMVFVGTLVGIAMSILGVKYALLLGLLAGLTEFIPIIGPVVAAVPALFFAFTDFSSAPYKPLVVLIIFIVIQQVENQLLVPRIMKKAVGINPIVVIVGLLVGAKLAGLVGMILAVPLITILSVFIEDFFQERLRQQNRLEE